MALLSEGIEIAEARVDAGQSDVSEGAVVESRELSPGAAGAGELLPRVQAGLHEAERHGEGR
jgi:hypothetical protein